MERSARQYQALEDPSFKKLYDEHRDGAQTLLELLGTQTGNPRMTAAVASARESGQRVTDLLDASLTTLSAEQLEAELGAFRKDTNAIVREQNAISRSMAGAIAAKAQDLKRALVIQAFLVIPISAALMGMLFLRITPPLRQMRQAIRELGRGSLGAPIRVEGARDLEELGVRLEWLRARLVELEAQKSQFLRNVSHELKTPLTNIREGAELLVEDSQRGTPADVAVVARIVQSNSVRLQRMIEALLQYGAEGDMNAGKADEPVQLDQLVAVLIERYAPDAATHSVRIRQQLDAVQVVGNAKRLNVIIENLLSNALKFTPPGGLIEVRLRQREGAIELEVKDDGPGIAEEDRGRVFEWFYSGPRPPGAIVAGSGMGLAIAREYAEQQDGRIELVPTARGAHFRLTLRKET
jgi:two-component system sensor histidine kinase GlrK